MRRTLALETPSYEVRIESLCGEGTVTCKNVRYTGTNKRTRQSVTLMGATVPAKCHDDGPCSLQAYEFNRGQYGYYVTKDAVLVVGRGHTIILREQGVWK